MSAQELRAQLIEDIQAVTDETILQELLDTLHCFPPFATPDASDVYHPTPAQMTAIQRGLDDVKAGRVFSEEEANRQADEWLSGK